MQKVSIRKAHMQRDMEVHRQIYNIHIRQTDMYIVTCSAYTSEPDIRTYRDK